MLGKSSNQLLCDAVKAELCKAFGEDEVASWTIESTEENECRVRTEDFFLIFYFDTRDETLSSSIVFVNEGNWVKERLYIHIISRIIPYFYSNENAGPEDEDAIARDVDAAAKILFLVKENKLSPRDLLYFYFGYNSGYGDSPKAP